MDQRIRRLITMGAVALICLVLLTAPVPAQQYDPLRAAFNALSAHKVSTLRFEGFGATYLAGRREPLYSYAGDLDVTPQGFLKAARANRATVRAVPHGSQVTFTADGRMFVGLLNARNEVDRVHTWVDGQGTGDTMVETLYRDYEKTPSGVVFPRHITQSRGGHPLLDVWVSAVSVNTR
jgi:hypothetical protein